MLEVHGPVDRPPAARVVAQRVGGLLVHSEALDAAVLVVEAVTLLPVAQPQLLVLIPQETPTPSQPLVPI